MTTRTPLSLKKIRINVTFNIVPVGGGPTVDIKGMEIYAIEDGVQAYPIVESDYTGCILKKYNDVTSYTVLKDLGTPEDIQKCLGSLSEQIELNNQKAKTIKNLMAEAEAMNSETTRLNILLSKQPDSCTNDSIRSMIGQDVKTMTIEFK